MPMPKQVPAGEKLEGWCRLVEPTGNATNTRLTHDAPFYIYNHHKAIEKASSVKFAEAAAPAPAEKPPAKSGAFVMQGVALAFVSVAAVVSI